VHLTGRSPADREVLAGEVDEAAADRCSAGDDAVGRKILLGHAKGGRAVAGEESRLLDLQSVGVGHDVARHGDVGVAIDIDMADAVVVAQHRHAALDGHAINQRAAAARHDQVEPVHGLEQFADRGAIGRRHELHAILAFW